MLKADGALREQSGRLTDSELDTVADDPSGPASFQGELNGFIESTSSADRTHAINGHGYGCLASSDDGIGSANTKSVSAGLSHVWPQ